MVSQRAPSTVEASPIKRGFLPALELRMSTSLADKALTSTLDPYADEALLPDPTLARGNLMYGLDSKLPTVS